MLRGGDPVGPGDFESAGGMDAQDCTGRAEIMKGVILHAGSGTRLRPLTRACPKQLLPVANKPMSQYALEDLREAGITQIAVVVDAAHRGRVSGYYGDGSGFGVSITYVEQDAPRGISHAIGLCREFVGRDRFVAYLGDNMMQGGLRAHAEGFGSEAMALLCPVADPSRFGIAELDAGGAVRRITEKPEDPASNLAVIGVYFLSPSIFDVIGSLEPSGRGELEITDALQIVLDSGGLEHRVVRGWWKDAGTPEDMLEANRLALGARARAGGSCLMRKTRLDGPALVGEGCTVDHSKLGPNVSVGEGCTVRGCAVRDSIIMPGCVLESGTISGSIIGAGSRVRGDLEGALLAEGSVRE